MIAMFINVPLAWLDVLILIVALAGIGLWAYSQKLKLGRDKANVILLSYLFMGVALISSVADSYATDAKAPRNTVSGVILERSKQYGSRRHYRVRVVNAAGKSEYFEGVFDGYMLSVGDTVVAESRAFDGKLVQVTVSAGRHMGTELHDNNIFGDFPFGLFELIFGGLFIVGGISNRYSYVDGGENTSALSDD